MYHVRPFTQFVPGLNHVIPVKTRYPGIKTRTGTRTGYTDIKIKLNHEKNVYMVHIYRYYNSRILSPGYYTILAGIFISVSILDIGISDEYPHLLIPRTKNWVMEEDKEGSNTSGN